MTNNANKRLLLSFIGLFLALTACTEAAEVNLSGDSSTEIVDSSSKTADTARVVRVVDGDTLILELEGSEEKVRLIGINTPESVKQNAPQECYGSEASDYLSSLLPENSTVRIERDVEARDQYDRLLLYVYREKDGLFINENLVAEGYAEAKSYRPNTTKQDELFRALRVAQEDQKGLWGSCDGPHQPLP